ncbi:MAG TPA: aminotransferase class V-fold PLP-dependent enzyme [Holophagaceae bacterium]|jgi:cysteine desulfurase|nr:aminotransferase class V-fold PLP-dependent enzyme [Holophagaceae bacterium]
MGALIYLDNNATTRTDPAVVEAMLPWFSEQYGNAGSAHVLGHLSEGVVAYAREQVAALLHATAPEIVFNSGATEGLNHALRGVFEAAPAKRHLVTTAVEHTAHLGVCNWLGRVGVEITVLGVDGDGRLDLDALEAAIQPDTALLSIMAANNETGVLFPLADIAARVKAKGALLHVDAAQAVGKAPLDLAKLPIDLLTLSGHKFHGPKGVGALFIRRGLRIKPFLTGHQERERRGGTENVPALAGLGKAAELAGARLADMARVAALRDRLEAVIRAIPHTRIHGAASPRLPNTTLAGFAGLDGEALLLELSGRGVCVSIGSACTTGLKEPSHVLKAMAVPPEFLKSTIRFSLSHETTEAEIEALAALLPGLVAELR